MNKKMRDIQAQIVAKIKEAEACEDLTQKSALLDEVDELQKALDLEARMENAKKAGVPAEGDEGVVKTSKAAEEGDSVKAFADAARHGFKSMNEGTLADGGYTVPEDIVTQIQHLREAKASLLNLVTVIPVKTNKGRRTFKARAQQTGFTKVGEGGKIGAKNTPQFTPVEYEIEKYAGYFPVTNELLADTDANITGELTTWIADESRVTANKLILEQVYAKDSVTFASLDDIKEAFNVTLGSAFKSTAKIITNDNGLQWLDTLKDADERYLLQPNPAEPMKMQLCAGATVIPVEVIPNADMPNDDAGIPFIVGDLKEGIIYWDRQQMNIKTSDVAAIGDLNAYEEDLTLFRAIEREDVTQRDAAAFVNGRVAAAAEG
ncbi:MAG: phage major capsid protein [Oscillospiraceae bacterium]|nr:phage major capsid protein [Oscillospiraceae bacterium]